MELLKDFYCEILYQPGRMNLVTYALSSKAQNAMLTSLNISKVHEHLGTSGWTYQISGDYIIVLSIKVEPHIITSIKTAQRTDPHIHRLKELAQTDLSDKFRVALDGSLRFNGRLVVPNLIDLKEAILREAHCSQHRIHPGNRKMYHTLRAHYWWEGMKKEISDFVAKCLTCQLVEAERMRPGGEFSYNNSFQTTIGMAPFEALYGRKCRSPNCWEDVGERQMSKTEFVQEMKYKVEMIRNRMKAAKNRQASYANKRRQPLECRVGDYVFLKVSPFRGTIRFGHKGKLAPRYIGPYEIVETIDTLAYRLDLPQSLSAIHDVFHVSMLCMYEQVPYHVLSTEDVGLDSSLSYVENPVQFLDRKEKQLKNKTIPLVKVQWSRHGIEEATLELEARMRQPSFLRNFCTLRLEDLISNPISVQGKLLKVLASDFRVFVWFALRILTCGSNGTYSPMCFNSQEAPRSSYTIVTSEPRECKRHTSDDKRKGRAVIQADTPDPDVQGRGHF
ncbi:uncharacterized protein LOC142509668 [Primulina tabacum]|uniref:uncharacterized protein LOC142509668 n=1 Tax=Primulina tabacum TaxID=48773 RepID=UPI003F59AA86